jgi:hypothetical protein
MSSIVWKGIGQHLGTLTLMREGREGRESRKSERDSKPDRRGGRKTKENREILAPKGYKSSYKIHKAFRRSFHWNKFL